MATSIRGLKIEIGANTVEFNKALSESSGKARDLQSELKQVERLLKLDPTNTELLNQRQKLLGESVENTRGKLALLKEAEEQLKKQQLEGKTVGEEQHRTLQREIVKTEQELKKLETAAGASNSAIAKISATAKSVSSAADGIAQKTSKLSAAAAGLAAGLLGAAVSAGKNADDINTLSKVTGIATDEIQKFKYASDIIDVSMETLTGSAKKLTMSMANAKDGAKSQTDAFSKLGVKYLDSEGKMRNNIDVMYDVVDALALVENSTERDAISMDLFGKSAQDLNPLILGGADALKQLGKEAEDAGLILSQDALDSANAFNDSIDKLKATAMGSFAGIGTEIATMLIPVMEDVSKVASEFLGWIRGLDEDQLKLIGTIILLVAAIAPVAKLVSGISSAIGMLSTAMGFLAANPIVAVVAAIVALVAGFVLLWNKSEAFRGFFIGLWDGIVTAVKRPINLLLTMINAVIEGVNFMVRGLNKININVPSWVPGLGGKSLGFNLGEINKIPLLANGGVLKSGSAIVGEAGAELLTMFKNQAIVTPLNGQARSAAQGSGQPIILHSQTDLIMDGKVAARSVSRRQANSNDARARALGVAV